MIITKETMDAELGNFGVGYEFPVYVMISNRCGFKLSEKYTEYGFMAIDTSGEAIIFTENSLMSALSGRQGAMNTIYRMSIDKIKINKSFILPNYTIDIVYHSEGKKKNYKFSLNTTVKGLPEQKENATNIVNILKNWA